MRAPVEVDGRRRTIRASSLCITANALDDESGRLFGRSHLDGGTLVLYVLRHLTLLRILILAGRFHDRTLACRPGFARPSRTAGGDRRRARTMSVMNDGELMELDMPLTYTIRPGALQVIAP